MKIQRLFRRLSRVADSSQQYESSRSDTEEHRETPKGHVPVYVGEDMDRFVVPSELLGRPVFIELLRMSAEEYGYEQSGALRIPCSVIVFRRVLCCLLTDSNSRHGLIP